MDLPRVLIIHPALAPYRIDLFNALALRLDLKIVFLSESVSYQTYDQAELRSRLNADFCFRTESLSILGRSWPLAVTDEIRAFSPEIVITHEFSFSSLMLAMKKRKFGVRHIIWSADNVFTISEESRLRSTSRRLLLPNTDGLILYSQKTADYYRDKFAYRGPIGVSPNTQSELGLRRRLAESVDAASRAISNHDLKGKKVLLSVGRLTVVKRYDRLLRAFSKLCAALDDVVLVLIGDGEERGYLEGLVDELGIRNKVVFGGHLEGDGLFAWYVLASCFALTSESETWGAVINEALVSGVPVICSNKVGASELIVDPSVGVVVDAGDEDALTNCLIQRLRSALPITEATPQTLRDSLMPQTFEQCVDGFVDPISDLVDLPAATARSMTR